MLQLLLTLFFHAIPTVLASGMLIDNIKAGSNPNTYTGNQIQTNQLYLDDLGNNPYILKFLKISVGITCGGVILFHVLVFLMVRWRVSRNKDKYIKVSEGLNDRQEVVKEELSKKAIEMRDQIDKIRAGRKAIELRDQIDKIRAERKEKEREAKIQKALHTFPEDGPKNRQDLWR